MPDFPIFLGQHESMSFKEESYPKGKTLGEALDQIFLGSGLSYVIMHRDEVVILKDPYPEMDEKKGD